MHGFPFAYLHTWFLAQLFTNGCAPLKTREEQIKNLLPKTSPVGAFNPICKICVKLNHFPHFGVKIKLLETTT